MSIDLQSFAFDTLLWTGALVAAVLVLRRPVSRHFGAEAAYALWALPFVRLVLPPIVLPASIGPQPAPVLLPMGPHTLAETGGGALLLQPMVASEPTTDWALIGLVVWLAGVLVFLIRRYALYFAMRRQLLRAGIAVGTRGSVRLIESPATTSPVAFGVIDKVIALPEGFMTDTDATRRDLALEHELAHHRAHDLLANALVQPVFALHWFNPLGWVGWRAMRRDQEAACDARVVARCDARRREAYATTIASFATRPDRHASLALAAPMACPVLGDKSIIHRLRSLTMSDISPRRRIAARTLLIGALAAVPLTASISYAEALSVPEVPTASAAPLAPAAPAAPSALDAPEAPAAPDAPLAPSAPADIARVSMISSGGDGKDRVIRVERKVEKTDSGEPTEQTTYTINGREATPEERAEIEAQIGRMGDLKVDLAGLRTELRVMRDSLGEDGKQRRKMNVLSEWFGDNGNLQAQKDELRRVMAERGKIEKETRLAISRATADLRRLRVDCDGSGRTVSEWVGSDGDAASVLCGSRGLAGAKSAIAQARRMIQRDRALSERERDTALRSLEKAMRGLEAAD